MEQVDQAQAQAAPFIEQVKGTVIQRNLPRRRRGSCQRQI